MQDKECSSEHLLKKFDKKCTKKVLRHHMCVFAKCYGVKKVIFNKLAKYIFGSYNSSNATMFISLNQTKRNMLATFFHELAHFEAVYNNLWLDYHANTNTTNYTAEEKFLIENNIDKIANALWNKYTSRNTWGAYLYSYKIKDKRFYTKHFEMKHTNKTDA